MLDNEDITRPRPVFPPEPETPEAASDAAKNESTETTVPETQDASDAQDSAATTDTTTAEKGSDDAPDSATPTDHAATETSDPSTIQVPMQPDSPESLEPPDPPESPDTIEQAAVQPDTLEQPAQQEKREPVSTILAAQLSMSVDDLLELRIASDPQISPDGSLVAFTVQQTNAAQQTTSSAIWLVSSEGGKTNAAWQVSSEGHHDSTPRWSPDGRTLAFLSDRSGSMQIYFLPMQGGEARQVTTLPQSVPEYSWRPGGQFLLAHSEWKPADEQGHKDSSDTAVVYTRLDAQWDGLGYRHGRRQQLWLVPLEGQAKRLTSEPTDLVQSCWSPDGTEVAFCANRRPDPDLSQSMALWVLTLATGRMRRLTPEDGIAQMPSWSPDGESIAYLFTPDQTEAGNMVPSIVPAQGNGAARPAVPGAEALTCQGFIINELRSESAMRPQWYPDGKSLLVASQERGQVHLYRLDGVLQTMTRLTAGNGCYLAPHLSDNGQEIALVRADWFTPGDIWCMDGAGKNQRKLTRVNDSFLQSRQLTRPKRITWQSVDGLEIEGWLYLPSLPEQTKAPLVLAVHGGPTLSWGDCYVHEFQVLAGHGIAVLAPNPRGSTGYGEPFTRMVQDDWGGKDFQDLLAGIDHVVASEPVDGTRLGIGGLSYGGYMTNWAISQTDRFKAAVSRNGISSIETSSLLSDQSVWFNLSMSTSLQHNRSALSYIEHIKTPLLILHAADDLRCPFSEGLQLFTALRKRKRTVLLVRYPNVSHLLDWPDVGTPQQRTDRLRRTVEWFERFL